MQSIGKVNVAPLAYANSETMQLFVASGGTEDKRHLCKGKSLHVLYVAYCKHYADFFIHQFLYFTKNIRLTACRRFSIAC